jgi:hypothetical protein|tara:strand:+ start:25144 stop:25332 length:189 start_codon:yes stop_codon:yes gene_type:complete
MTYRKLALKILEMTGEQLDSDVTVFDYHANEFFPVEPRLSHAQAEDDILDENHPYLTVRNLG